MTTTTAEAQSPDATVSAPSAPHAAADGRWRELMALAADMAFETDAAGRLVFLHPDTVLGWPAQDLIGQSADRLMAEPHCGAGLHPFHPAGVLRDYRAWLRRRDGSSVCMLFTTVPLRDDEARLIGARGIAVTESRVEAAGHARTDLLTGLYNRRGFMAEITRRIDRLEQEGLPGTLLFVDVDDFKSLNNAAGRKVGDEALCRVAGLLRATVRPADLIARLGGDEFAVWMDGSDELTGAERAEMLRMDGPRALVGLQPPGADELTMSIGIATCWPGRGETIDNLLSRADRSMSRAKSTGRGKWCVARDAT